MDLGGATVSRWRRYGKDRLYVARPNGTKLGWIDLQTREIHPLVAAHQQLFEAVLADWSGNAPVASQPAERPDARWSDLSLTAPGAAAREQAVVAREGAPVRTLLARLLAVHTDERAWRIGAAGEERVAARLAKLQRRDPRWQVLHAIPVGKRAADIDHLVMGPGGVFSLNAKHHPNAEIWVGGDTFMVNGSRTPYVRNSRHEAARASKLLTAACGFDVRVSGVIVTVNAADVTIKRAPDDVFVLTRMHIVRWLRRRPGTLDERTITQIYDAARRSTTWG
jgi:hypothetical protein